MILDCFIYLDIITGKKMSHSWSDEVLSGLSEETMKALKDFASKSGVKLDDPEDKADILESVHQYFQAPDREDTFHMNYISQNNQRNVSFSLKGIKRELGQTLNSTGLTIWRAAEHLCQYLIDHPEKVAKKDVCELGAGLGLVSVLVDKLNVCSTLVSTDGDEDTMDLLIENKIDTDCTFDSCYLYWGEFDDFLTMYPKKFDVLLAADVIYEDEQVNPLIETVDAILKGNHLFFFFFIFNVILILFLL